MVLLLLAACSSGDMVAPDLHSLPVAPGTMRVVPNRVTLQVNQPVRFQALSDQLSLAKVHVTWTATGGTIAPDGTFQSSSPGTFKVVGRGHGHHGSDTSTVVVVPPGQPVAVALRITPDTASLQVGTSLGFKAETRMSDSTTTTAASVAWSAAGGTITSTGLFTAGSTAGSYRVVARDSASGLADTAAVTVVAPAPPPPAPTSPAAIGTGIPFGPSGLWDGVTTLAWGPGPFTATIDGVSASTIVSRINAARTLKVKLVMNMTGGNHSNYLTNGVFDRSKWEAKMQTYNTSAIKQAVAAGVADGTIIGESVMDEPQVSGQGDGNTWGPPGTMTKARVDSLCSYVKTMFPTMPVGVAHDHRAFEPDRSYRVCEFIVDPYSIRDGDVKAFRDAGLALANRDHHAIIFSMNVLNGGVQDKDGTWDCTGPGQAGRGTYQPNCRMTASTVREVGRTLGVAGCAMLMWRYDDAFMTRSDNQLAFKDVADLLATMTAKACRRQ